ncbi:MAG: hypothetical protein P4N60_03685 [Verrucomicrobiae bacterium]|nr:hypothetical protein [Verrucomicrobiae bacterium]
MKIALTILCTLLLLGSQMVVASASPTNPVAQDCGCGGKMACCRTAPASHSNPLEAASVSTSQQILSPVPATVVWVLAAAGTPSLVPPVSSSLAAAAAPLYARICVRLI